MAKRKVGTTNQGEPIIDDSTWLDHMSPNIDGEVVGRGYVPRDYSVYPPEMLSPPSEIQIYPRSEWSARIKEAEETKSRISDVLLSQGIPSMSQGSSNYCWTHSTVGGVQAVRAVNNQPYVPLSAFMVAAVIKRGANEGGWCGLSAKFLREVGVCSQTLWPQGNRSLSHDTPECRADAAKRKVTEDFVDLTRNVYDQNLTVEMVVTCLLNRIPVAGDFSWWGHSVLLCDPVEVEPGSFGIRIRNSWGDGWGEKGFGILRGPKAITDGAVAIRVTGAVSN